MWKGRSKREAKPLLHLIPATFSGMTVLCLALRKGEGVEYSGLSKTYLRFHVENGERRINAYNTALVLWT